MWKLGNLEINGKVVLGPMAGYTSFGYRSFFAKFGVALTYTEMVSDMGIIYGNKETISYLPMEKEEVPVGIQLFGSDPENLKKATEIVMNTTKYFDFIDVNMGCPVPKVTKTGAGSALMKDPKRCGDIIRAIKSVYPGPVTAKIRLGWDDKSINYLEVIKELEDAGVSMIAIHARTKKELYSGTPHFDLLKDLRSKMKAPLVVSGNIFTVEDANKALELTGADAVMIARGGIGNPLLVHQINVYQNDETILEDASLEEQVDYCLDLARHLIEEKGEEKAMLVYRSIAPRFFSNLPMVKKIKTRLANELKSYKDLENIIYEYLEELRK
ncbi:MAG: tRNA-dihydrouridine synthase family protein [Erysipelotrichaceae bacterium]|nr:tRNA-dihydrouridine synthase family protein [Erysipelotrichaceae bacterium]